MGRFHIGELWKDDICFSENLFACEIQGSHDPNCDTCTDGFYGSLSSCQGLLFKNNLFIELSQFSFYSACDCNENGTQSCNRETGECICIPNVTGAKCDTCIDGYYGSFPNCKG